MTPSRIQCSRAKGWRKPADCVIVRRPSRFENPFTLAIANELGYVDPRAAVVGAFEEWLRGNRDMWQSDEGDRKRERILADLHQLRGKTLACTCPPGEKCHADVLIAWADADDIDERIARARARVDRNRVSRGDEPLHELIGGAS